MAYVDRETARLLQEAVNRSCTTFSPDLSSGEPVPVPHVAEPPAEPVVLGVDALSDGWTVRVDGWFSGVRDYCHHEPEDTAHAVARTIHSSVLAHSISPPDEGEGTVLQAQTHALAEVPRRTAQGPAAPSGPAMFAPTTTNYDAMEVDTGLRTCLLPLPTPLLSVPTDAGRSLSPEPSSPVLGTPASSSAPTIIRSNLLVTSPESTNGVVSIPAPPTPSSFVAAMKVAAARCGRFDMSMTLSQVCAPLRIALHGDPDLWTRLRLHSAASVEVFESLLAHSIRAGERRLLSIDIVLRSPADLELLLDTLGPALLRARHLAISVAHPNAVVSGPVVQRLFEMPASLHLTSLRLHFHSTWRPQKHNLLFGTATIRTLACQLWQIEHVDPAVLSVVREFVALRPHPSVGQSSHTARQVAHFLENARLLVLDHSFSERKRKRGKTDRVPRGWQPLQWLILDQRTGFSSWDAAATKRTLDTIQGHLAENVVVIRALEDTAEMICANMRDYAPREQGAKPAARLAVLTLGGQLHCALASIHTPARPHYFLAASCWTLKALHVGPLTELTLAAHLPEYALDHVCHREPRLASLTIWLNTPAVGLESLLTFRRRPLGTSPMMRKITLVAACPPLPAVCRRLLPSTMVPAQRARRAVPADQLLAFIAFNAWPPASLSIVLGDGVELGGDQYDIQVLRAEVREIVWATGPPGNLL